MFRLISKALFKLWGFKVTGKVDFFPQKVIFAIIPHTSNWDFPLGILTRSVLNLNLKFVAKDSLFKPPFGFFFRWLGGIPIDRSKNNNYVDAVIDTINQYENLSIAIAPEGTRKKVDKIKSGFYWIAHKANIPLVLVKFDFENKEVHFSEPFLTCGDYEKDLEHIHNHFRGVKGKNPDLGYSIYI